MAEAVARGARAAGSRLVHISTDGVFDGERGGYREEDVPSPINVYGQSKLEGEQVVAAADPQALIVRTNIYGWNAQPKSSLAEWFLAELQAGRPCPGFTDAWFSPILVNDLGGCLFRLLASGQTGPWHVGGGECLTKHAFGVLIARVFGFDPQLIRPAATPDGPPRARRGRQLCLRSLRIDGLAGLRLPAAAEGLTRWKQLGDEGLAGRLRGLIDPQPQAGARDV